MTIYEQNTAGEWVPSVPLPFYGIRKHCPRAGCGRRFWTVARYRRHYSAAHHPSVVRD